MMSDGKILDVTGEWLDVKELVERLKYRQANPAQWRQEFPGLRVNILLDGFICYRYHFREGTRSSDCCLECDLGWLYQIKKGVLKKQISRGLIIKDLRSKMIVWVRNNPEWPPELRAEVVEGISLKQITYKDALGILRALGFFLDIPRLTIFEAREVLKDVVPEEQVPDIMKGLGYRHTSMKSGRKVVSGWTRVKDLRRRRAWGVPPKPREKPSEISLKLTIQEARDLFPDLMWQEIPEKMRSLGYESRTIFEHREKVRGWVKARRQKKLTITDIRVNHKMPQRLTRIEALKMFEDLTEPEVKLKMQILEYRATTVRDRDGNPTRGWVKS